MYGELRRFLKKGSFDILPYTQTLGRGKIFYETYMNPEHKQTMGRRIIHARLSVSPSV